MLKARLLYREGLGLSARQYALQLCQYAGLFAVQAAGALLLCRLLPPCGPWLTLLYRLLICAGVFGCVNLVFLRSHRVRSVRFVLGRMLRKEEPCSQAQD